MVTDVVRKGQFETGTVARWIALSCVILALLMTGLEVTHVHSGASLKQHSACAICLSVQANAPAVTFHFVPALLTVAIVLIPYESRDKSTASDLRLFIRPPPSV